MLVAVGTELSQKNLAFDAVPCTTSLVLKALMWCCDVELRKLPYERKPCKAISVAHGKIAVVALILKHVLLRHSAFSYCQL